MLGGILSPEGETGVRMGRSRGFGKTVGLDAEECFPQSRALMQSSLIAKGTFRMLGGADWG